VTENVWPAIVIVPVRDAIVAFAVAEYDTVPFPAPETPELMVSHESLLTAVQLHPTDVVTFTLPKTAAAEKVCETGAIEKEQGEDSIVETSFENPLSSPEVLYEVTAR
jgi:hypothetical protein